MNNPKFKAKVAVEAIRGEKDAEPVGVTIPRASSPDRPARKTTLEQLADVFLVRETAALSSALHSQGKFPVESGGALFAGLTLDCIREGSGNGERSRGWTVQ